MGKSSHNNAPPPINIAATAQQSLEAQQAAAAAQQNLNSVDYRGPGGSVTYGRTADGRLVQNTALNDAGAQGFARQQALTNQLYGRAADAYAQTPTSPVNTDGIPYDPNQQTSQVTQFSPTNLPYDPAQMGDISTYSKGVADAHYNNSVAQFEPQFQQQQRDQIQGLEDRGLPVGGEAYNKAVGNMNQTQQRSYAEAANNATIAGENAAQQQLAMRLGVNQQAYGQASDTNQRQNQISAQDLEQRGAIHNAGLNDRLTLRNQQFQEAQQLLGAAPGVAMPAQVQGPQGQIQAADVGGLAMANQQAAQQAYQARLQNQSSTLGGLGSLALAAGSIYMGRPAVR